MNNAPLDLRLDLAKNVVALVDAIRNIPPALAPTKRASTTAIREQFYHGYERPLARARGGARFWGTYEEDRPWSVAAAALAHSDKAVRGQGLLNRDHVVEAAAIVRELLEQPRSPEETADLLDQRLLTCTVLATEHAKLKRARDGRVGWDRYTDAKIAWQDKLVP